MDPDPAPQNNADLHPQPCILLQQFTIHVSENDLFIGNIESFRNSYNTLFFQGKIGSFLHFVLKFITQNKTRHAKHCSELHHNLHFPTISQQLS
jgi:hypothetical protein